MTAIFFFIDDEKNPSAGIEQGSSSRPLYYYTLNGI